jgi:RimJ/RimL family protein N-acetyltransferase
MPSAKFTLYSDTKDFRLRQVEREDLSFLMELRNHPETKRFLGHAIDLTIKMQEEWFLSLRNNKNKAYYIFEKSSANSIQWISIGMVRTHDIDNSNKHMGVGGDILFEYRGHGYAIIMYELIFKLAFEISNLHRLWLSVIEYNTPARELYKKMGFKETGIQREAILKDGKYYNYIYMDILETEYNIKNKE